MTPTDLDVIEARAAKATKGPWEWYGNTKTHSVQLATTHSGRVFVMTFNRWGMRSAQPMFQRNCRMEPVKEFARYEVDYRRDFIGIDHPDATFIAAARADVPALCTALRDAWKEREGLENCDSCQAVAVVFAREVQIDRDATLSKLTKAVEALQDQIERWQSLPSGVDEDADASNESPEDAAAFVGGLAVQAARAALKELGE